MLNIKKEVISWQSDALRGQEVGLILRTQCYAPGLISALQTMIRDLEQTVRALSDQIKFLSINTGTSLQQPQVRNSPGAVTGASTMVPPFSQQQAPFRHPVPPVNVSQMYGPPQQPPPQQSGMQTSWFPSGIPAPQASHPTLPPPTQQTPPAPSAEELWDDTYLNVLGTQDLRPLRDLLARSNPDVVMPLKGQSPLSQAVILTLVHRVSLASA